MNKGYSTYIRPISTILDLLILNILFYYLIILPGYIIKPNFGVDVSMYPRFFIVINIGWLIIAYILDLYKIFRFTRIVKILRALTNQILIFTLLFSTLFAWSYLLLDKLAITIFIVSLASSMYFMRLSIYFGLKNYRAIGRNYRRVIIVGYDSNSKSLYNFFKKSPEYGYKFYGFFSDKEENKNISRGNINNIKDFVLEKEIDEIYCTISELGTSTIKELINFADNNLKVIKFIPDNKGLFDGRELKLQYYDFMPIFTLRENPFEDSINKWMKRIFDIIFSSFVIVFVLSWLIPVLGIFIKLESKGPILFKQKRSGLDNNEFGVYKFRSMGVNKDSDKLQATKDDPRITKIGTFIRKTSIDELPQFINVLKGEMSVVGPRPHMLSHTDYYSKVIDKFLVRHMVKPGITGLAQIRGFRGETETVSQMKSRARVDIFYIENWSMLLDIKIIIQTVVNAIKGEKEAY